MKLSSISSRNKFRAKSNKTLRKIKSDTEKIENGEIMSNIAAIIVIDRKIGGFTINKRISGITILLGSTSSPLISNFKHFIHRPISWLARRAFILSLPDKAGGKEVVKMTSGTIIARCLCWT
jgi:hypothetical protein